MPVTLEIAGRAVSRLGNAAVSVPVVVRNAITLASAWSGVTDSNGYFTSALLDDAAEYRAEVEYDTTNHYKTLRDLASGQMNMLQVRKRFHVRGASTPCVIDGAVTVGTTLNVAGNTTLTTLFVSNIAVSGSIQVDHEVNATDTLRIGGQSLDDRYVRATGGAISGAVLAPAGSPSLPAYSFSGSPDSGVYMIAGGGVGVACQGNNVLWLDHTGAMGIVGFFGSFGSPKNTVTGSRGGNVALASLLTALSDYGLITDSTSA